jgi:hypothetical protein
MSLKIRDLFPDGDYVVTVHDGLRSNIVVAELSATMHLGDDATVIPFTGVYSIPTRLSSPRAVS